MRLHNFKWKSWKFFFKFNIETRQNLGAVHKILKNYFLVREKV